MKKTVIVDFDLTLVKVNSFEFFYKELAKYALRSLRISWFVYLLCQIVQRKMRLITHAELKKRILLFLEGKDLSSFLSNFVDRLKLKLAMDVVEKYTEYRNNGYSVCLCTAAPELYVLPFLQTACLEFDAVVCSPKPQNGFVWEENLQERKKQTTLELIATRDEVLAVLMTDHRDDLPLLRIKKEKNILVRPSQQSLNAIKSEGIQFELLG